MKTTLRLFLLTLLFSTPLLAQQPAATNNVEIIELNDNTFKKLVWDFDKNPTLVRISKIPVLLDFHATWCRPCKMLAPHIQAIQNQYKGRLIVYKIDVDQSPVLARKFNVTAMPTLIFINSKTSYKSELGYRDFNDLEALVKSYFFVD